MDDLRKHLLRAREGDTAAFDKIVACYQDVAFRYAFTILRDPDAALDATQDALVQAYRGLPGLREPSAFPAWLRAIVSRCAHRLARSRREQAVGLDDIADLPSDDPAPQDLLEERELAARVAAEIKRLPEGEREVTGLFYFDARSQREIAEILDLPVTTVNNRLYSSRKRLRMALSDVAEPIAAAKPKEITMQLKYRKTRRKLLKGDVEVTVRTMTRADIPAMRRLDEEIAAGLDFANAQRAPGSESGAGGPWSDDEWMALHFDMYESTGNITLLVEDETGKLVSFAELWATTEPEPFGRSLDVECNDYLWEYHGLGIEIVLLEEAEKVARSARIPALDLGTNTSSGCYPALRRFGMRVFYEHDSVVCRCDSASGAHCPPFRMIPLEQVDRSGLIRISHWGPTDFDFAPEPGRPGVHEFVLDGHRVVADFYRLWEQGHTHPIACELFGPPEALTSPNLMNKILQACVAIACKEGAKQIPLPCPSDVPVDESMVSVVSREFQFAWMRKRLTG